MVLGLHTIAVILPRSATTTHHCHCTLLPMPDLPACVLWVHHRLRTPLRLHTQHAIPGLILHLFFPSHLDNVGYHTDRFTYLHTPILYYTPALLHCTHLRYNHTTAAPLLQCLPPARHCTLQPPPYHHVIPPRHHTTPHMISTTAYLHTHHLPHTFSLGPVSSQIPHTTHLHTHTLPYTTTHRNTPAFVHTILQWYISLLHCLHTYLRWLDPHGLHCTTTHQISLFLPRFPPRFDSEQFPCVTRGFHSVPLHYHHNLPPPTTVPYYHNSSTIPLPAFVRMLGPYFHARTRACLHRSCAVLGEHAFTCIPCATHRTAAAGACTI